MALGQFHPERCGILLGRAQFAIRLQLQQTLGAAKQLNQKKSRVGRFIHLSAPDMLLLFFSKKKKS